MVRGSCSCGTFDCKFVSALFFPKHGKFAAHTQRVPLAYLTPGLQEAPYFSRGAVSQFFRRLSPAAHAVSYRISSLGQTQCTQKPREYCTKHEHSLSAATRENSSDAWLAMPRAYKGRPIQAAVRTCQC